MDSLISNERECFICGRPEVHRHHIFAGGRRRFSEEFGLWVYLCPYHHNMSDEGVHFNKDLDTKLKTLAQREFEKDHSRDEFRRYCGKSYL